MKEAFARRLSRIPDYLFRELDDLKASVRSGLIDLSEGSPDLTPPKPILAAFAKALKDPANHRYPSYAGKLSARAAVADWYRRRFRVKLDPETEVTMLLGSKEGVAHLIWGVCDKDDIVAVCDPGYPVYANQTRLAGASLCPVPLEQQHGFLPSLSWLESIAPRLKLLCLNFPNNPTAAVADIDFYSAVVKLALRHGFYVVNDNVYSELTFDTKVPSILQVPDAGQCCLEFHSLSKTFSLAGWRIGMAVGCRSLIAALLKIKQNTDSGPFGAIQDAAAWALKHGSKLAEKNRRTYQRRRDLFCQALARNGWTVPVPAATFYVWAKLPDSSAQQELDDALFVQKMLKYCRVMAAPGSGFGQCGRGYVRFALVANGRLLQEAAARIGRWLSRR
ncbi:MAG: aminotransferase class I/II-fold pyridoxal phosphate-dependent enzyme [candidate division WOR-3 bacterium]